MCLRPESVPPVPEMTGRVARVAFPKGNIYLRMRDEMGPVFADEAFAPLFPARGQPAFAPWRLALVTIMQYAEGLSDEQAADAVRGRIDWKYAFSLDLTDAGFDGSVLSEFRTRLVQGNAEELLFATLLEHFRRRKLLAAHWRQRTDSTHVLAAIRTLNRLEEVGETLRHALNALAVVAPDWLRATSPAEWLDRYSQRFSEYRLPKGAAGREALALRIGTDGFTVLEGVFAADTAPWLRQVPAVEALRRIWIQHFYRDEAGIHWRRDDQLPPAPIYVSSPYDPDARYVCKRTTEWVGYKVHLTETCEPDAPHLITHVETTPAPLPDHTATNPIHQALKENDLLPAIHLVDGGYVQGALLATTRATFGVDLLGPAPPESCWQAREPGAFAPSKFRVDWEEQTVTCPEEGEPQLERGDGSARQGGHQGQVLAQRLPVLSEPKPLHPQPRGASHGDIAAQGALRGLARRSAAPGDRRVRGSVCPARGRGGDDFPRGPSLRPAPVSLCRPPQGAPPASPGRGRAQLCAGRRLA